MNHEATLAMHAWMNFPQRKDNKVLENILRRSNKNYGKAFQADCHTVYWNAESLGLDRVPEFREASPELQQSILEECSHSLLREAFAIERAGMAFAAKMVLLSDDLDSRILYSQFGAQEAAHYQAIAAYVHEEPLDLENDPFLSVLKNAIETGGRMGLTLIIQVFLEGWGLLHYKKLAKDCLDADLADEFKQILQDEAHHHGSGIALLDMGAMSEAEREQSLTTLRTLLSMVSAGPWNLASILQKYLAPDRDPSFFYEGLDHLSETNLKLQQLKRILIVGGAKLLVDELDQEGMFLISRAADLSGKGN